MYRRALSRVDVFCAIYYETDHEFKVSQSNINI